MAKGKKILKFKDEKYSYIDLLDKKYLTDELEYDFGEVEDLQTGESFDINELGDRFVEANEFIIENIDHLDYKDKYKLRKMLNPSIMRFKRKKYNGKLEDGTITKKELEELILIEDSKDIKKEFEDRNERGISANIIDRFMKVNIEETIPKEVSLANIGRYYRLLEVLINENKVFKKPHGNSSEPTRKELMKYLNCNSTSTFNNFIKQMEKYNIARRFKLPNNRRIIFINPLYAHKNLIISKELYNIFKDVLKEKLTKRLFKYLEFIYNEENNISGSISYEDK